MHPTPRQPFRHQANWSTAQSSRLYGLDAWGQPYFSISEQGHVTVQPRGPGAAVWIWCPWFGICKRATCRCPC